MDRPHLLLSSAFLTSLLVACSGGSGSVGGPGGTSSSSGTSGSGAKKDQATTTPGEGRSTSSSSSSSSSSSGSSKPSGATDVACSNADDCGNWFCYCDDPESSLGTTPVNARNCENGWCMDAAAVCPGACTNFGYSWGGSFGGSAQP